MGRLIFIISTLVMSYCAVAQDTTFRLQYNTRIAGEFTDFSVDNMGNIYLVTKGNQVKKLNNKWDSVAVFNDSRRYGKIYSIDVSNPLKILVYYKDYSTIVVLNRFLGVVNTIDLRQHNITDVKAITLSYDNNIWLYDEVVARIKKIDDSGKLLLESADLRMALSEAPAPVSMIDDKQSLYLYDNTRGWFVFDYYGAYRSRNDFKEWKDVQVINRTLIGRDNICILSAKTGDVLFTKRKCSIDLAGAVKVQHLNRNSYILFPNHLEIYDSY